MIHFFCEDITFEFSFLPAHTVIWLEEVVRDHFFSLETLNYIFCSDPYLLKINQDYLQHDFFTDVITFDHAESPQTILGDIFISLDRVHDNALTFSTSFDIELLRVIVHGLLHLLAYDDTDPALLKLMRHKEDYYLNLYRQKFANS